MKWNSGNNPTVRLVDADGNRSSWIDLGDNGIVTSSTNSSLNDAGCDLVDGDISAYIGDGFDRTRAVSLECSIVIWDCKGDASSNFKKRNKGIEVTSVRVASHAGECD